MPTFLAEEARRRGYEVTRAGSDYVITNPATGRSIRAWKNVQYVPRLDQFASLAAPAPRAYPAPRPTFAPPSTPTPPTPVAAGRFYRGLPEGFRQTLSELTGLPQPEFDRRFQGYVGGLRPMPLAPTYVPPTYVSPPAPVRPWTPPGYPADTPGWWNAQPLPQARPLSPDAFMLYLRDPNFRRAIDFLMGPAPIR